MGRVHSDDGLRSLCEAYHVNYDRIPAMARDPFWYPYSGAVYRGLVRAMRVLFRSGVTAKLGALFGSRPASASAPASSPPGGNGHPAAPA